MGGHVGNLARHGDSFDSVRRSPGAPLGRTVVELHQCHIVLMDALWFSIYPDCDDLVDGVCPESGTPSRVAGSGFSCPHRQWHDLQFRCVGFSCPVFLRTLALENRSPIFSLLRQEARTRDLFSRIRSISWSSVCDIGCKATATKLVNYSGQSSRPRFGCRLEN
jgi:hypothetical protein